MISFWHAQFSLHTGHTSSLRNGNTISIIFQMQLCSSFVSVEICSPYSILNASSSSLPMKEHRPWGVWGSPSIIGWMPGARRSLSQPSHYEHRCIHHLRNPFLKHHWERSLSSFFSSLSPLPPSLFLCHSVFVSFLIENVHSYTTHTPRHTQILQKWRIKYLSFHQR